MKSNKENDQNISSYAWIILFPVFLYGALFLISKIFINIDFVKYFLWMRFIALSSFVVMGGFFLYYILTYGLISSSMKNKKWHTKRIVALCLTVFLLIVLCIMFFTSQPKKDYGVIILGILLGGLYVVRGGTLPRWLIEYTQKFNFFTGGIITADDDPANISPRIYLPIISSVILIAIIAYAIFIRGY